jgi:hypothetical protein
MNFAGAPAYTPLLFKSFVTIEPAPTITLSPIVTPGKIMVLCPMKLHFPILISFRILNSLYYLA